jgi:quinol monooxygenase YgiN
MVSVGLFIRVEAQPAKASEVADFLRAGLSIVEGEPATTVWYAVRFGPSSFAIFDAFADDTGRRAHLTGRLADALAARAGELLAQPPTVEPVEILAAKLSE